MLQRATLKNIDESHSILRLELRTESAPGSTFTTILNKVYTERKLYSRLKTYAADSPCATQKMDGRITLHPAVS